MNNSGSYVNKFVGLFGLIVVLIVICLVFYFILPNNYKIVSKDKTTKNINKIKIELNGVNVNDESNRIKINSKKTNNKIIKFNIDERNNNLNLIISNSLKSQNITLSEDTYLEIYDSDLTIINNKNYPVTLEIEFFAKI